MTSAFLLLIAAGAAAAVIWLVSCFLQFLMHGAILGGTGLAIADIAPYVQGDVGIFMMAALMAVVLLEGRNAWLGFKAGITRTGFA